jgi:hypothetical protein
MDVDKNTLLIEAHRQISGVRTLQTDLCAAAAWAYTSSCSALPPGNQIALGNPLCSSPLELQLASSDKLRVGTRFPEPILLLSALQTGM